MKDISIKRNFILNTTLSISNIIFPLILFPHLSRTLLAEGNGKVDFATSIINYFIMFSSLGIPTYGIRACSQVRNDKVKRSKIAIELFVINLLMTAIMYAVFVIMICFVPKMYEEKELMIICSCNLILNAFGVNWLYAALEEFEYIVMKSLLFKLCSLLAVFLLIKRPQDYILYALVLVISTSGSNLVNFINARNYIIFGKYDYTLWIHFKPILYFFATSVAVSIYTNLDIVMLGFLTDNAQVGYYSLGIKIRGALLTMATSLGTVLLPRLSNWIEQKEYNKFRDLIHKSFQFMFLVTVGLCLFFIYEAPQIISLFAGKEYFPAVAICRWLIPTAFVAGLSNVTGIQCLIPMNKEKYLLISIICGAVTDFVLNIFLINRYRGVGAAIATLIAEIIVLFVQGLFLKEYLRGLRLVKYFNKCIISGVIAIVCTHSIIRCFDLKIFLHCIICALLFGGVYVTLLVITNYPSILDVAFYIRNVVTRKRIKGDRHESG